MGENVLGNEPEECCCPVPRKMTESEIADYRQRMISKASGSNIHALNNALQGVILSNELELFTERDGKMKDICSMLYKCRQMI